MHDEVAEWRERIGQIESIEQLLALRERETGRKPQPNTDLLNAIDDRLLYLERRHIEAQAPANEQNKSSNE